MNDRALSLLEQYAIEVLRTRKGRGAFICDTNQGTCIMKEYSGNPEKLSLQQQILQRIKDTGLVLTEELIPCKDEKLYVKDNDGTCYILKTHLEGSECNIYDRKECLEAIRLLARLHNCMNEVKEPWAVFAGAEPVCYSPLREYEKHNRELIRVRSYLKKKGQKQIFEIRLLGVIDYFLNQARKATEDWRAYEESRESGATESAEEAKADAASPVTFCHGDYQHHNILRTDNGWCVINFEKVMADNPIRDLYLFMRKVMEKNNWPVALGKELLGAYEENRGLDHFARKDLYYRFTYPEKFWKIANFYYNSPKAWIPEKNLEKLEKVISQEKEKQIFLRDVF